ncbi:sulfotransferase [Rubrobacter tropicus]|uniref:Sulfotransferase n=2 Tax=Rubrobacter tropicus TaxID=2653851 RepID=A0A6G8QFI1_9ACTN|nr:sulfotransferase [Rubrobacter tropicus]
MTLPNFLVVGAAKSGTTALYHYLKQHPQVYMGPTKETNFFAFEGQNIHFKGPGDEKISETAITDLEAYKEQFAGVCGEGAIGEASPWYLYSARSAENIHRHIPDAKLIIVLRNPAERAFSSYLHVARDGREHLTFKEGLLAEEERIEQGWEFIWHYQRTGFYAAQVGRFFDVFPREQVRVYLYDDLLANPMGFLKDIYVFLGVDPDFVVDTSLRPNATGIPKNRLLGKLLLQPNPLRSAMKALVPGEVRYGLSQRLNQRLLEKPRPDRETYAELLQSYKKDIRALQDLIGRDLSVWIAGQPL